MTYPILRLLAASAIAGSILHADDVSRIDQLLTNLEHIHHFSGVNISPDGSALIWTEDQGSGKTSLFLKHGQNGKPVHVTAGTGDQPFAEGKVAWSHDSKEFVFVSNAGGSPQLYLASAANPAKPIKLTNASGDIFSPLWSADDKDVAFLFTEGGGAGGPLAAVPAQTGVIGTGFTNQRLMVVNVVSHESHAVTSTDLNIYEYDWAPDDTKFVATAAPGPADNNWWIAKLYSVNRSTGKMTELFQPAPSQQIAAPRWSPDNKKIAFICGLMSDEGFLGGDIFTIDADGENQRNLTTGIKSSPNGLRWKSDEQIIFTASLDGGGSISSLNVRNGSNELLWKGEPALHEDGNYPNFSLAADGTTSAAIFSTWQQAPEVWTGKTGAWTRVTNANATVKPEWGKAESINWNDDDFRVQGWLLYPENFNPSQRYPMVVSIHGGPASERSPAWPSVHFDMSAMAGLGYFVFFPNPRGSYGEGEAFTRANIKDFGYGDLRDILSGVDAVLKQAPVDPDRIGLTGWSYGGYMTMWAVTQTARFRAAVAGAGIADWLSYYGENSIDEWMIPYFGASVYDAPQVYANSSPITYIKHVKTPTLVVVGERDGECPAPQSFEFWHALRARGIPTELVVYPGEGHSFSDMKNRTDVMRRTLVWFDHYLGK